jgi:hypothetical protein
MNTLRVAGLAAAFALLTGCATFPTQQVSLDLSQQTVPVMLTAVKNPGATKTFALEAGFAQSSMSSSSTQNGVTTTMSMNEAHDTSKPLAVQVQNLFIQDPAWVQVGSLDLTVLRTDLILYGSLETISYTTNLGLLVPTTGATK